MDVTLLNFFEVARAAFFSVLEMLAEAKPKGTKFALTIALSLAVARDRRRRKYSTCETLMGDTRKIFVSRPSTSLTRRAS